MVDGKPVKALDWALNTEVRHLGPDLYPANTDWDIQADSKTMVAIAMNKKLGRVVVLSLAHLAYTQ